MAGDEGSRYESAGGLGGKNNHDWRRRRLIAAAAAAAVLPKFAFAQSNATRRRPPLVLAQAGEVIE